MLPRLLPFIHKSVMNITQIDAVTASNPVTFLLNMPFSFPELNLHSIFRPGASRPGGILFS